MLTLKSFLGRDDAPPRPQRKVLYLHIGHYKTGTTALQVFLERNAALLNGQGVDYVPVLRHFSKHSELAFALYGAVGVTTLMHDYVPPVAPEKRWEELFTHIRGSDFPVHVASSEELMRLGEFPEAVARLAAIAEGARDIDIRVVAYLRDPAGHLRSWYNQLVKMGLQVGDFNAAVTGQVETIHLDYGKALRPWADIFGAENLTLRPYDAAMRHGTALYEDFLRIIGVTPDGPLQPLPEDPNPRMDDRLLDLVRILQNAQCPRPLQQAINARAADWLAQEGGEDDDFSAVHDRIRDGLQALEPLSQGGLDLQDMARNLPHPDSPESRRQLALTGFVLTETVRLAQNTRALRNRVEVLEARLDSLSPPEQK